ncbi:hypothetical protein Tco_1524241 [Tanacetum coccineum]
MGLWYSKDTGFELTAFSDSDHAGCLDLRKSTAGGHAFLGTHGEVNNIVSFGRQRKRTALSMSSAEPEAIAHLVTIQYRLPYTKHFDVQISYFIKEQVDIGYVEFSLSELIPVVCLFTKALSERYGLSISSDDSV